MPDPWAFYHGCWSTSSAGAVGPMVCIVPDTGVKRVEMLSVVNDSIVARLAIDASGAARPFTRGRCDGFESARWSGDGERLYMHAEYRCGRGGTHTSDAIIAASRSDAFTHVERETHDPAAPARVVNFIVQLDTTAFPAEVKRRLATYRTLALETAQLEQGAPVPDRVIGEAAGELDLGVVQAWLADRGQETYAERLRFIRVADSAPPGELWPRGVRFTSIRGRRVLAGTPTSPAPRGGYFPVQGFTGYVSGTFRGSTADHPATVELSGWLSSLTLATSLARSSR